MKNNMHRDAGEWRHVEGIPPLSFQKRGNGSGEAFSVFIIGVAGKFLGCEGFFPNFPNLAQKVFLCNFCLKIFFTRS